MIRLALLIPLALSTTISCAQPASSLARAIGEAIVNVDPYPFGEETAVCVGQGVIDRLGERRLRALRINEYNAGRKLGSPPFTGIGFSDTEINHLLDAIDQCTPFIDIWEYVVRHSKHAGDWLDTEEISEAFSHCIHEVFPNDLPRQLWHTLFTRPNPEFVEKFNELSDPTTGCFEAIFCGKATILGSFGYSATVLPGGGSVTFNYGGGGTGGLTFNYSLPMLSTNTCPFKRNN